MNSNTFQEEEYLNLLRKILLTDKEGRQTRNAKTYSMFGPQIEFDLSDKSFPLLTTKKMFLRGIFEELMFFIRGQTDSKILEEKGVNIWKWNTSREFLDSRGLEQYEVGDMGPLYGFNWRHFGKNYEGCDYDYRGLGFDQLREVIESLTNDPHSRRHLLTTYDPSKVSESVLAPCHGIAIQFYVDGKHLDCKMYQRSADCFLGVPFNIASYALLMVLMGEVVNLSPRRLILTFGDTHIYEDHLEQVSTQLQRKPYPFPKLILKKKYLGSEKNIDEKLKFLESLEYTDIELIDYVSHPAIKAAMIA